MTTKTIWGVLLIFPLIVLSGCAQKGTPIPASPGNTQATPSGPAAVELTEEQDGGLVALIVGDLVRVQLDGNPTTGYTWEPDQLDTSLLQLTGQPDFAQRTDLPGGGGSYTFTFKALKAGTGHLRLIYHRTFEKGVAPQRIFDVTVDIQDKP